MIGLPQVMMIVAAVPYMALAAVGFTMWRDARSRPRWEWLWAFGGLFALHLWVPLGEMVPGLQHMQWVSGLLAGLAYLSLLEFARATRGRAFPRWVEALAVVVLLGLLLAGYGEDHWPISLALGVPSGLLSLAMLRARRQEFSGWEYRWATLLGVSLVLIPAACCVEGMLPVGLAGWGIAVFATGTMAALAAVLLDASHIAQRRGRRAASNYLVNVAITGLVMGAVLGVGLVVAHLLAETTRQELRSAARQRDNRIATMINTAREIAMEMADSLSGSPLVLRRFTDTSPEVLAGINNVVDRYAQNFRCDVVYVLDARGVVLATSNRDRPDSLLGADLGDREYVRQALGGERCAVVRLGGITRTRGIYAATPVRDADGTILGIATVKNDLETLERQLGSEGHIVLADPQGMIWLSSREDWCYQRLWNRHLPASAPAAARVDQAPSDLLDLPDPLPQVGQIVTLAGEPHEINRTPAGPEGWSLVSFTPVRPALRTWSAALLATGCAVLVTLGVASSLRLRAAHAEAHQHEQMLSTSLKEMERLMSVLSHDLRAPLAAAHCSAEYLLEMPEFREEAREALEMIAEQQLRMAEMVSRMLDAIRIRNGAMEWAWENVLVHEVLASAHRTVASLPTRSPDVQVELDDAEAPATIRGDAQAITRLVTNLATNAVRHTKQGMVRISARVRETDAGQWLVIEAADTGGGIAPDVLPLLGRPFVLGARQGGSGGSGLGLAIAAGICAAHGGRLTVRSQVGRGTIFTAWLRADLAGPVREGSEPTIQVEQGEVIVPAMQSR